MITELSLIGGCGRTVPTGGRMATGGRIEGLWTVMLPGGRGKGRSTGSVEIGGRGLMSGRGTGRVSGSREGGIEGRVPGRGSEGISGRVPGRGPEGSEGRVSGRMVTGGIVGRVPGVCVPGGRGLVPGSGRTDGLPAGGVPVGGDGLVSGRAIDGRDGRAPGVMPGRDVTGPVAGFVLGTVGAVGDRLGRPADGRLGRPADELRSDRSVDRLIDGLPLNASGLRRPCDCASAAGMPTKAARIAKQMNRHMEYSTCMQTNWCAR